MKAILIITFTVLAYYSSAQSNYQYSYDQSGNRVSRVFTSGRMADPNFPKDSPDVAIKYGINVYPNPTSQNINVTISALTNGQSASASVYLFNEQGKSLLSKKQTARQEMIEFSNLSSGVYQLKVVINSEQVSYRIVKL